VSSRVGEGTVFRMELPGADAVSHSNESKSSESNAAHVGKAVHV